MSAGRRSRGHLKRDGTRTEKRFRLSAKRTSPYKSARWASVQSTTGSRGVRISGSNAGYTMFRGSVKGTGYPLHSAVSPSLPPPPVRHRVPSHFNWSLRYLPTPYSTVLLEKLTGSQSRISTHFMEPECSSPIHKCPPPVPILSQLDPVHTPTLILSSHLRLGLPSGLFPSGFPTRTLYTSFLSTIVLHTPPIPFFSIW